MAEATRQAPLDVASIRDDFPILSRTVYGKPLVYLDNAATSQKPRRVISALTEYYENYNSNVHRGVHALSMEATDRHEEAREKVARFIGASQSEEIIWTRNTTEAINLVAWSWGRANLHPGDEIVVTEMEHHSDLVPWQRVAQERGATLRFLRLGDDGKLELAIPNAGDPSGHRSENRCPITTRFFAATQNGGEYGLIVSTLLELRQHPGLESELLGKAGVDLQSEQRRPRRLVPR